jgi:hypothetical protein
LILLKTSFEKNGYWEYRLKYFDLNQWSYIFIFIL